MINPQANRNQKPDGPGPLDDFDEDQREILEEQTRPLSMAEPELFRGLQPGVRLAPNRAAGAGHPDRHQEGPVRVDTPKRRPQGQAPVPGGAAPRPDAGLVPDGLEVRLQPGLPLLAGLAHGPSTRNVTIDLDNHGPRIGTFRRGYPGIEPFWPGTKVYPIEPRVLDLPDISVAMLDQARRLHGELGREARWAISSRSLGFHVTLPLGYPQPSHGASERVGPIRARAGLPGTTEVYPMGRRAHRLPFGLDYLSFAPDGRTVPDFPDQMRLYLGGAPAPAWDDLLDRYLGEWHDVARDFRQHATGHKAHRRFREMYTRTSEAIDHWRAGKVFAVGESGGNHPLFEEVPRSRGGDPSPRATEAHPDWAAYRDRFRAGKFSWIRMVQDLAVNGLPCATRSTGRPVNWVGSWSTARGSRSRRRRRWSGTGPRPSPTVTSPAWTTAGLRRSGAGRQARPACRRGAGLQRVPGRGPAQARRGPLQEADRPLPAHGGTPGDRACGLYYAPTSGGRSRPPPAGAWRTSNPPGDLVDDPQGSGRNIEKKRYT